MPFCTFHEMPDVTEVVDKPATKKQKMESDSEDDKKNTPPARVKKTMTCQVLEEDPDDESIKSIDGEGASKSALEPKNGTYLQVEEQDLVMENKPPNVKTNVVVANINSAVIKL